VLNADFDLRYELICGSLFCSLSLSLLVLPALFDREEKRKQREIETSCPHVYL